MKFLEDLEKIRSENSTKENEFHKSDFLGFIESFLLKIHQETGCDFIIDDDYSISASGEINGVYVGLNFADMDAWGWRESDAEWDRGNHVISGSATISRERNLTGMKRGRVCEYYDFHLTESDLQAVMLCAKIKEMMKGK